ncbi:hypothetical protein Z950_2713 [Sulfitobacter mediterraneus KCTC 32188]|nr:hypothetical protein Z950_2713 [Sulfitobacter mediterraneus KCTC 32188]
MTALDYENQTDVSFDSDADLHAYLHRLYDYLYRSGPIPDLISPFRQVALKVLAK